MSWIDARLILPPDNSEYGGKEYLVTVRCNSWDRPQTMIMSWETKLVRNKFTRRWKWKDRLVTDFWVVTHWMEFPSPASEE